MALPDVLELPGQAREVAPPGALDPALVAAVVLRAQVALEEEWNLGDVEAGAVVRLIESTRFRLGHKADAVVALSPLGKDIRAVEDIVHRGEVALGSHLAAVVALVVATFHQRDTEHCHGCIQTLSEVFVGRILFRIS